MPRSKDYVRGRFGDLWKTSTLNNNQPELVFASFSADRAVCVVKYLQEYSKCTASLRGKERFFFVGWCIPHRGICQDTVHRWTKTALTKAGTDMLIFTPHSTRAPHKTPLKNSLEDSRMEASENLHNILLQADCEWEAVLQKLSCFRRLKQFFRVCKCCSSLKSHEI